MIRSEINLTFAEAALAALDARLTDMTPVMDDVGQALVLSNRLGIDAGESPDGRLFAPRSAATIARYRRLRKGFGIPLTVSGDLKSQLFHQASATEVSWGSNLIYSAVMQFGAAKGQFGQMANGSPIPWGNIPARPFIGVSTEDEAMIVEILSDWLETATDQAPGSGQN